MRTAKDYKRLRKIDKFFKRKPSLIDYSAESSFRNVFSWMVRYDSSSMSFGIMPDFVTAFSVPIKYKASFTKLANCFRWFKRWQATHVSTGTGIFTSNLKCDFSPLVRCFGSESPFSMQDSMILRATSSAISIVSAMVLPWAISPCRTGLVAKYGPSSKCSIDIGIRYSDIGFVPPVKSITQGIMVVKDEACPLTPTLSLKGRERKKEPRWNTKNFVSKLQ